MYLSHLERLWAFTPPFTPTFKQAVGGHWIYEVKESPDGSETCKVRYVAKGHGQLEGLTIPFGPKDGVKQFTGQSGLAL